MKEELMSFERCKNEFLKKVEIDEGKIQSMMKIAELDMQVISGIEVSTVSASKLAKDYYEVIQELLTALLLAYGTKSSNHECLIAFFKEKYPSYEYEVRVMHELKNIRNKISYYGYFVEVSYIKQNLLEFKHIIELLKKLINEKVP